MTDTSHIKISWNMTKVKAEVINEPIKPKIVPKILTPIIKPRVETPKSTSTVEKFSHTGPSDPNARSHVFDQGDTSQKYVISIHGHISGKDRRAIMCDIADYFYNEAYNSETSKLELPNFIGQGTLIKSLG